MKPAKITSAILCSSLLLGTTAARAVPSQLIVSQVQLNSALTQMTITGQGFAAGDHVTLGTSDVTSQCSLGSATLITCNFTSALNPGEYRVVVLQTPGIFDVFDLTTPLVGPAGPQGPAGPGVKLPSSCGAFGVVTGFDAGGNVQCQCGGATFMATTTAAVSAGLSGIEQFWVSKRQTFGGGGCTVTVDSPSNFIDNIFPSDSHGWFITSAGWTTCALDVRNPICTGVTDISAPSVSKVIGTFPLCTGRFTPTGSTGSTDAAFIICNL
jgi:hypothetical protein